MMESKSFGSPVLNFRISSVFNSVKDTNLTKQNHLVMRPSASMRYSELHIRYGFEDDLSTKTYIVTPNRNISPRQF